ncbi:MAG: MBL fold metallo-hydrolase, partial [Leptolyngbyaceae cyanobacterium SM2_3_12]|nr:MBL fold metallo-hydrolase [Leptolyngbyaceae cyanobacterium SM2_3_12]
IRRLAAAESPEASSPGIVIGHRETDLSPHCRGSHHPWTILLPESFAADMADTVLTSALTEGALTLDWLQTLGPELESGQVQLDTYLLTTHSDCAGTTQLIHNLRPQHVVFFHGKPTHLADLTNLEELQTRYQLHLPSVGNWVEFPIGDRFIQPAAPEPVFDGEITQVDDSILMLLSEDLTTDPRWRSFADTGLVQARWQGDDLVIKSVSQQDLLRTVGGKEGLGLVENCQRCRFLREGHCRNSASSLYGLQVSPDGYCPAFAPQLDRDGDTAGAEASA